MARQLRSRIIPALTMDPLEHVLVNLLGAMTPDSSYRRFFEEYGITQASELASITENRLATVSYGVLTPSVGDTPATILRMFLPPAQQDRILKIVKWFLSKGTDVTNETWFELTPEVLDQPLLLLPLLPLLDRTLGVPLSKVLPQSFGRQSRITPFRTQSSVKTVFGSLGIRIFVSSSISMASSWFLTRIICPRPPTRRIHLSKCRTLFLACSTIYC
jgi:hypothetical protein